MPNKVKNIWLLIASYYFYMCWNIKYTLLLLISTVITYLCGILVEKIGDNSSKIKSKLIVALCITVNLAILFFFKYFYFAFDIFNALLSHFNIVINQPSFDILLPVGISFYTFQALGYTIDVYRGDVKAEKNIIRYALFVSFFPQLVAGPIERSSNLINQFKTHNKFNYENARDGLLLMLWGYFLKIVIADRIAIFVDSVYGNITEHGGLFLVIATILFAFQIYCDFAGYSTIAIGSAKILGFELMKNFDSPYLAFSVTDFWRRWHISLTTWFKDYLYIPLGGNRKGKPRKFLNKFIVFSLSGLWHGADLSYVVWGALNAIYQIVGELTEPLRKRFICFAGLNRDSFGQKLLRIFATFVLVDFAFIFFRADGLTESRIVLSSMLKDFNPWILFDGSLYSCGLDVKNFNLMLICLAILAFVDICNFKKICIREFVVKQDFWYRCIFIALSITVILTFGIWGPQYSNANFIYFQF